MDFAAYMASSGSDSESDCGSPEGEGSPDHSGSPGGEDEVPNPDQNDTAGIVENGTKRVAATREKKIAKYRSLLEVKEGDGKGGGGEEVMEVTWEPGLRDRVEEMVRRRRGEGGGREEGTTWDRYLRERKKKLREKRREKVCVCVCVCVCVSLFVLLFVVLFISNNLWPIPLKSEFSKRSVCVCVWVIFQYDDLSSL